MTYGELNDTLEGISLSLSGDMMLGFGQPISMREFLVKTVGEITKNENERKGLADEERQMLPEDTLLDPTSEAIWEEACKKLDELNGER